jgi:hypothetical protein
MRKPASIAALALLVQCVCLATSARGQDRPLPSDVGALPEAGAFVIQTCGESMSSNGWSTTGNTNPGALAAGVDCPPTSRPPGFPTSFQQAGIWVSDRLGDAGGDLEANSGDRVEAEFLVSTGASITRLRYWRAVHKGPDPGDRWHAYVALDDRHSVIDTCDVGSNSTCAAGADDWLPNDASTVIRGAYRDLQGISASSLIVGLYCTPNEDDACGTGASLTDVDVEIFSAFLTISDPAAPLLGTPAGEGWTADGWVRGDLPLAVASMDNTGIAATKVYADGSLVRTLQRVCSYDRPRPCSDEPVGAVGLPTAGLADGVHVISVGSVDAAGNETKVDRPALLKVDNNAPGMPVGLVSPAPTSTANRFTAHWSLPADAGSPIVAARYQVCQAGTCGAVGTAPALTGVDGLTLPAMGEGTVRVWLVDELGQEAPASGAQMTINYVPEPAPSQAGPGSTPPPVLTTPPGTSSPFVPPPPPPSSSPPTTALPPAGKPAAKADPALKITSLLVTGRRVALRGTISARASGRVTVRFRARAAPQGKTYTITARPRIRAKAFRATLTLPRALDGARSGTATVTYSGDADTRAATRRATARWRR